MLPSSNPRIVFFQHYLRSHVLNFARFVPRFDFSYPKPKITISAAPNQSFEAMVTNRKTSRLKTIQRLIGLPNVRLVINPKADLLFSYSGLVVSNKPYVVYIETGLAFFNYDPLIAHHPLAIRIVSFLTSRKNCRQLIFMSEAAQKSFYATLPLSPKIQAILKEKSSVIYPITNQPLAKPKVLKGKLRLLFVGNYYIKGGMEVVAAYERLQKKYKDIELTMVTPLTSIRPEDQAHMKRLGVVLLDARLKEAEMAELYRSHHIFLLPTYRESLGLVIIEAMAAGLPVICTDQFATAELVKDGYNGFVFPNHPLKDYNPATYKMYGKLQQPIVFFERFFQLRQAGKLRPVEDFLCLSLEKFLTNSKLITEFSHNTLHRYKEKFATDVLVPQMAHVLYKALPIPPVESTEHTANRTVR